MADKKNKKALILFSGGLDSILAAEILRKQHIEITCFAFTTHFFGAQQAVRSANILGFPLRIVEISKEFLEKVKTPEYGRGSGMNPCIDCHLLMLRKAKEIMEREEFDFVATGEVVGERPVSQNKKAMELVKKESGLNGYLLRPLSAGVLEETVPEKKGWVHRNKLFAVQGRQRKKQISLADKFGIEHYPAPAGGCILCEKEFAKKLSRLLKLCPNLEGNDIELLKTGRHFWHEKIKIVVGREHQENLKIKELARPGDVLVELSWVPGPTTLLRSYGEGRIKNEAFQKAKSLTKKYANKAEGKISFNINKI